MHNMDPQWFNNMLNWQLQSTIDSGLGKNNWMGNFNKNVAPSLISNIQPNMAISSKSLDPMSTRIPGSPPKKVIGGLSGLAYKTNDFLNSGQVPGNINKMGSVAGVISSLFPKSQKPITSTANELYDITSNALMKSNPVAGGIMKIAGLGDDLLRSAGFGIDKSTNVGDDLLSSKWLSTTPIGLLNTATKTNVEGSAGIGKDITHGYAAQNELDTTDIGGVTNWFSKNFGKKDLKKNRTNAVTRINSENAAKKGVLNANQKTLMAANNTMQDIATKNYNRLRGPNRTNVLAAKQGGKLELSKLVDEVINKPKNVIPSGALHARKNNLPEEIAKHVTHKGIPVIINEEGGEITQTAEIEHSEIIFTLEVTNKLEELMKEYDGGNEEALIKAGKLLTKEILDNTEDNVGLIEKI